MKPTEKPVHVVGRVALWKGIAKAYYDVAGACVRSATWRDDVRRISERYERAVKAEKRGKK